MAFSLFCLAPISLSVWFIGINIGLGLALLCAIARFYADINGGRAYSENWIPYRNSLVRLIFFILVVWLLHKFKSLLTAEEPLADTDTLTPLCIRRVFLEKIDFESNRSKRYGGSFTLAYIDLDNFKSVNDLLGHDVADDLLVTVGKVLKTHSRSTDIPERLGGDEFGLLMPQTQDNTVVDVLEKLRNELLTRMSEKHWPVTFSFGAVTFNKPDLTNSELIDIADKLMY